MSVNKSINENEFTNAIINKISNQKISTVQKGIGTLSENPLLNNLELKSLSEVQIQTLHKNRPETWFLKRLRLFPVN